MSKLVDVIRVRVGQLETEEFTVQIQVTALEIGDFDEEVTEAGSEGGEEVTRIIQVLEHV